ATILLHRGAAGARRYPDGRDRIRSIAWQADSCTLTELFLTFFRNFSPLSKDFLAALRVASTAKWADEQCPQEEAHFRVGRLNEAIHRYAHPFQFSVLSFQLLIAIAKTER